MSSSLPVKLTLTEMQLMAKLFHESRMFPDIPQAAQAFVKIQAGQELGIPPYAAMNSIHIIKGKTELSADAQARLLKSSGKYDYQITTHSDSACAIEFYSLPDRKLIGVSSFTMQDAQRAGLTGSDTWKKFPRNMLFARALTNGIAWHCPDAVSSRLYGEGELEAALPHQEPAPAKVEARDQPVESIKPAALPAPQPSVQSIVSAAKEKLQAEGEQPKDPFAGSPIAEDDDEHEYALPEPEPHPPADQESAPPAEEPVLRATRAELKATLARAFPGSDKVNTTAYAKALFACQEAFGVRSLSELGSVSLNVLVDGLEALKQRLAGAK